MSSHDMQRGDRVADFCREPRTMAQIKASEKCAPDVTRSTVYNLVRVGRLRNIGKPGVPGGGLFVAVHKPKPAPVDQPKPREKPLQRPDLSRLDFCAGAALAQAWRAAA